MKHLIIPLSTLTFILNLLFAASAAVPLSWTVETTRAQPATFEAYQGETIAFEAALTSRGKPLELSGLAAFYWQTNGMGTAYWESTAAVNSNRLSAVFTPEMDVGAKVYNCFIGQPGTIYHAAFQLRLRPSPGATPNVLPLPVPVIDFAKVRVLNPPWSGGGGGVDTNAVRDIVREQLATNGIRSVDGEARPLPKYLHALDFDDTYPADAAWYYAQPQDYGLCSSVRDGGYLYRNYDWKFDDAAEFVVKVSAGPGRFASVGVANCGTNLTEGIVTSGRPSRYYKCLPGHTVDGINENGVACNINVVDGAPAWHTEPTDTPLHPLAAIRWILDNATNAQSAAEYIAANIRFPSGWTQNFHYMIVDGRTTYIVENGVATKDVGRTALTNFQRFPFADGSGIERYLMLSDFPELSITNAWFTRAYSPSTSWRSDFNGSETLMATSKVLWAQKPKEAHRGERYDGYSWWQTVHTSIYDLTNRTLRIAVQERDDWYVFQVPSSGAKIDAYTRSETDELLAGKADTAAPTFKSLVSVSFGGVGTEATTVYGDGAFIVTEADGAVTTTMVIPRDGRLDTFAGLQDLPKNYAAVSNAAMNALSMTNKTGDASIGWGVNHENDNPRLEVDGELWTVGLLYGGGRAEIHGTAHLAGGAYVYGGLTVDGVDFAAKADRSMIHHTNKTFSNEVAEVARTVTPTPTGTLRLFDPVLNRWVILKSVNMNLTLEVE